MHTNGITAPGGYRLNGDHLNTSPYYRDNTSSVRSQPPTTPHDYRVTNPYGLGALFSRPAPTNSGNPSVTNAMRSHSTSWNGSRSGRYEPYSRPAPPMRGSQAPPQSGDLATYQSTIEHGRRIQAADAQSVYAANQLREQARRDAETQKRQAFYKASFKAAQESRMDADDSKKKLFGDLERSFRETYGIQLMDEVREKVYENYDEIYAGFEYEVKNKITTQMIEGLEPVIKAQLMEQYAPEVKQTLKEELKDDVKADLKDQMRSSVRVELKEEMRPSVRVDLKEVIRPSVTVELKEEMRADVEANLKEEMRGGVRDTLFLELEPDVRNDIEGRGLTPATRFGLANTHEEAGDEDFETASEDQRAPTINHKSHIHNPFSPRLGSPISDKCPIGIKREHDDDEVDSEIGNDTAQKRIKQEHDTDEATFLSNHYSYPPVKIVEHVDLTEGDEDSANGDDMRDEGESEDVDEASERDDDDVKQENESENDDDKSAYDSDAVSEEHIEVHLNNNVAQHDYDPNLAAPDVVYPTIEREETPPSEYENDVEDDLIDDDVRFDQKLAAGADGGLTNDGYGRAFEANHFAATTVSGNHDNEQVNGIARQPLGINVHATQSIGVPNLLSRGMKRSYSLEAYDEDEINVHEVKRFREDGYHAPEDDHVSEKYSTVENDGDEGSDREQYDGATYDEEGYDEEAEDEEIYSDEEEYEDEEQDAQRHGPVGLINVSNTIDSAITIDDSDDDEETVEGETLVETTETKPATGFKVGPFVDDGGDDEQLFVPY